MTDVIVVGGGASGMMAAITAASFGAKVTLVEQNDRVGRKILSTGNGRCNYTNLYQEPACYHSQNTSFPWGILQQFDVPQTVEFFRQLGIHPKDRNGYLYPNSDQASSVLDVLRMECVRFHIDILTERKCLEIIPEKPGFLLKTNSGKLRANRVILAAGSRASAIAGSDGSGYTLAKQLGHSLTPIFPALVQLRCKESFYKSIAGVRVQGQVSLYADDVCIAKDKGELQLTNYGISGIPVFQVSGFAAEALYQGKNVTAVLDFMPEFEWEEFLHFLDTRVRMRPEKTLEEFFIGLFPKKLCDLWIRLSQLGREQRVSSISKAQWISFARLMKLFQTTIIETNPFEQAQVCRGGIDTRSVHPQTLESCLVPGLYFAGEILDVDGLCGGYNLQWAWSSGHVAGREAAHA